MGQIIRSLNRLQASLLVAALLGACSLLSPHHVPPVPLPSSAPPPAQSLPPLPAPTAPPSVPPPPVRRVELSAASRSLVTLAHTQLAHGDYPAASSTLDRALRIEPGNALLWIERGRVRLAEGDPHQAEGCARKALALASGDVAAQEQAGRLLADAQQAAQHAH